MRVIKRLLKFMALCIVLIIVGILLMIGHLRYSMHKLDRYAQRMHIGMSVREFVKVMPTDYFYCYIPRMRRILIILLLALPLFAQSPPSANSRTIYIDVTEKPLGVQIDSLRPQDFRVRIDNRNVPVASVERKALKPKVIILFDTSGSISSVSKWNAEVDLATAAIKSLQPVAEVALLPFSDERLPLKLHDDPAKVLPTLESARKSPKSNELTTRGRTALRDTMMFAISEMRLGPGDALVIISDAGDNVSKISEKESERQIRRSGVRVFAIVMGSDGSTPEELEGPRILLRIAAHSGGLAAGFGYSSRTVDFTVRRKEQEKLPTLMSYIARRIVSPYKMKLDLPPTVSGKLKIELVDSSGKRRKGLSISAPERVGP